MSSSEGIRRLIFNADDFGYSPGINRGIVKAINEGVVKSTSVMVNRTAAAEARNLVKRQDISVGLHLDMTEEGIKRWLGMMALGVWSIARVQREFDNQVRKFKEITGRSPDHIDSHHHIHRMLPNWRRVVSEYARENGIPIRSVDAKLVLGFFGRSLLNPNDLGRIGVQALIRLISSLKPGTYEIMTHPGIVDDDLRMHGSYLEQREVELETLTSEAIKDFLYNSPDIEVISWRDLKNK